MLKDADFELDNFKEAIRKDGFAKDLKTTKTGEAC
jgi:hypothetical protein